MAIAVFAADNDVHWNEQGSGAIFRRSCFAHGYRHGYEEGYHLGNLDINMNRKPRAKREQFHGLPTGYLPRFGGKKSFENGFWTGLKAGYGDGYAGRNFRAVNSFRALASSINENPAPSDPHNLYFDSGFSAGYGHGLRRVAGTPASISSDTTDCAPFPIYNRSAQDSFCEGYRRGYVLGHGDGLLTGSKTPAFEARR
ncbi:MAG TPA: hypothetical protein VKT33_08015 [Candidatus Angelobacter sp.]|nr:hypothetical protein [Candidatus Angelobacter sp.]